MFASKILAVCVLVLSMSCTQVDPIYGVDPMDTTYVTGFPLDTFHSMGIRNDTIGQRKMINDFRKQLTKNVINHFPCITDPSHIQFVLGSGLAKKVQSGDGKLYDGTFKNELIIILNDSCIKDTFFLACGNGMLGTLSLKQSSNFGTAENCRIVILPGEGLAHHLPELQAWGTVANNFSIPIRDSRGKVVQEQKYLNYLGKYESVLFPGDVIDMCQETVFDDNGVPVDFNARLAETERVNKAIKATAKKSHKKIKRHK